ncbi:MAG: outer membrane protein assembly factor BamA [Simkaniaceae bacterium]|nr:outer membrane protein assembly factor BamA [Simkaniaceae bacterium]
MIKRCFLFILLMTGLFAADSYEGKTISDIRIHIETLSRSSSFNPQSILTQLRSKPGDPFSQQTFDQDLKSLSEKYDRIDPELSLDADNKVTISLKLWHRPLIKSISWHGNLNLSTGKLSKELGIAPYTTFNRSDFTKAFNKVKEYYIKKGFFEVSMYYKVIQDPSNNEVDIEINIDEGHWGHIGGIKFQGLSPEDESAIMEKIQTKKYNFFTSWLTGRGIYHQDAMDHDKLIIVNFLQNQGYADARVNIEVGQNKAGKIIITVSANKGPLYHFGDVSFSGNTLYTDAQVETALSIKEGGTYSNEALKNAQENLKNLYGRDGYIETEAQYTLTLNSDEPVYDVHFNLIEGEQFKIGLIRVLGNSQTDQKVILRESHLVPSEVFDSRKLQATQHRLEAVGYFKSVNVYPVKSSIGPNYRDVIIEVEETTTGSVNFSVGFSSLQKAFGEIGLTENNFNIEGLRRFWKDGISSVRGGGQYFSLKASFGSRQQNYDLAWMDPYFLDTAWRFGFDLNYSLNRLQSKDYQVKQFGGSLFSSYPLSPFWTYSMKLRGLVPNIHFTGEKKIIDANEQINNSGVVVGFSPSFIFDSTDNAFKPHRGYRSVMEVEICEMRRHNNNPQRYLTFIKAQYLNNFYYPIWRRGTLKFRAEGKVICPLNFPHNIDNSPLPLSERYFLGGETTVRGYQPFILGKKFNQLKDGKVKATNEPIGGLSSLLLSLEYLQTLHPMIDGFVFFDSGSITMKMFSVHKLNMSYGAGLRLDIGNRLPFVVGFGIPINPKNKKEQQKLFFSMGGQF